MTNHIGVVALARYCGTTPATVSRWVHRGNVPPTTWIGGYPAWSEQDAATIKIAWWALSQLKDVFYGTQPAPEEPRC